MGSNLALALPSKKEPLPSSALSRKLSGAFTLPLAFLFVVAERLFPSSSLTSPVPYET